jgi:hypothetical protein
MTTIAEHIASVAPTCSAVTLYGGYGMRGAGEYVRWPIGHQEAERRNDKGRCTYARYHYADGSVLEFRYSDRGGATYRATQCARAGRGIKIGNTQLENGHEHDT